MQRISIAIIGLTG